MTKRFFKKQLLAFSALAFISYGVLWACADGGWGEDSYSAYTPEAFVDSAYKPFFYSDMFYYDIGHDVAHNERFNQSIVAEWAQYLGRNASDTELAYFLLSASKGIVDSVNQQPVNALPSNIGAMYIVQHKSDKKLAAFFKFLSFAKANENYAVSNVAYWDYDDAVPQHKFTNEQIVLASTMLQEFNSVSDNFIKQRYFFQLVRNYFFQAKYDSCLAFYNQYQAKFPQNIIAARSSSYVAGAYYKQKNYAQANYLFSKVYDVSSDFKTVAHFSFHPQNETDWKQTLALCQNKEEQITLWQLLGIYYDEQRSIREIYAINPKSDKLDLLLTRMVNKIELKSNWQYTEYGAAIYKPSKDSVDATTVALITKIAEEQKTAKPYLWHLSAGYLYFLSQDYAKARSYYALAQKNMPKDELSQAQIRLLVLMNKVASCEKVNQAFENEILPDLKWLNGLGYETMPSFRYSSAYAWMKEALSSKYKSQKEYLRSELFLHQDTFYAHAPSVTILKAFLLNKNVTPFEQYCKEIYPISAQSISEYQSILFAYKDQIDEAIVKMQESDSLQYQQLLGNPFNGNIQDCHDCDHAATQKVKYSKISFLQKLKEMKANVQKNNDVYNNALLLGNAFYNMTHYGNARFFYEGAVMGSGHSVPDAIPNSFRNMLVDCSVAKGYYKKALAAATTDEQKAKVTYLLLKIERNEYYNKWFSTADYNSWDYADVPPTNFSVLYPYQNTKYYKEIIAECGYFKSYLIKKGKL